MNPLLAYICGAAALGAAGPALAQTDAPAPRFSISAGATGWNGDYGASTTTKIRAGLLNGRYTSGDFRLGASIPWMQIKSDGTVFTGIGGTPLIVAPGVPMNEGLRKGVGDLTLGAAYVLPWGRARGWEVELNGRTKLPTASDSSGVSTGETDYSVGAQASHRMGRLAPFASVTYRWFGDPGGWDLQGGFATSIGGSYVFSNQVTAVASYDFAEAASRFVADSHEIVAGLSIPVTQELRLTGFASKGLSDGAADVSAGASLAVTF